MGSVTQNTVKKAKERLLGVVSSKSIKTNYKGTINKLKRVANIASPSRTEIGNHKINSCDDWNWENLLRTLHTDRYKLYIMLSVFYFVVVGARTHNLGDPVSIIIFCGTNRRIIASRVFTLYTFIHIFASSKGYKICICTWDRIHCLLVFIYYIIGINQKQRLK